MYFLTIISPFYNSEKKCKRLLSTLLAIQDSGIEVVLVDDGSTDSTLNSLYDFKKSSRIDVNVIAQDNKGPGGARNAGLKVAKGKYIWFVDSDDDIRVEALDYIKSISKEDYNFIDFDWISGGTIANAMGIQPGIYKEDEVTPELLFKNFGWICTKVFNKQFLIRNDVYYPEYCIYEDGPLMAYIYPFICKEFIKSDIVGYVHQIDYPSITRGKIDSRYFDRLYTSIYGYKKGIILASNHHHIEILNRNFLNLYLLIPVGHLSSVIPSKNWLLTYRVMKQYRKVAKELKIKESPRKLFTGNKKFKFYFLFHWYISFLIFKDQTGFFEEERYKNWQRPFI